MHKAFIPIALSGMILAGCGGHATSEPLSDPRAAAIATYLNSKNTTFQVANGPHNLVCSNPFTAGTKEDPVRFSRVKGAHVRPVSQGFGTKCYEITWDKSIPLVEVGKTNGGAVLYGVVTGHYVVDKVGDEEDGPAGIKETPYKAHYELTPVAKSLAAAGYYTAPDAITDGQAELHKDADGKLVAGL